MRARTMHPCARDRNGTEAVPQAAYSASVQSNLPWLLLWHDTYRHGMSRPNPEPDYPSRVGQWQGPMDMPPLWYSLDLGAKP